MKLQNMALIFIIIVLPIIILVSYYISLQTDTLNRQQQYDLKLVESLQGSMSAFEINTVELNPEYSTVGNSKQRDVIASINMFTNLFSNTMGYGGLNKEYILQYIPALVYTLYDGFYIYSPSETKEIVKDSNGQAILMNEDLDGYSEENKRKLLYVADGISDGSYSYKASDGSTITQNYTLNPDNAKTTYEHILKPFSSYSARYKDGDTDIVVNYTLDNYITVYGKVNGNYENRSGYLIDTSKVNIEENNYKSVTLNGVSISPETLKEQIAWKYKSEDEEDDYTIGEYIYVYSSTNTKVYFDVDGTPFQVNSNGIRTNLSDLSNVTYKKLVLWNGEKCTEVYQALVSKGAIQQEHWYAKKNEPGEVTEIDLTEIDLKEDVSAINYCVESYAFTKWVNNNLGNISVDDMQGDKSEIKITGKIFENIEDTGSVFAQHKREVIKQVIISSLNQAITSYSRNSPGEYRLPVLSETDWDKILSNVSLIGFVQDIPIGAKYYNNYAIATSTRNKEYVDPNEIYLNSSNSEDSYHHKPYCSEIKLDTGDNLVGYKSIDYVEKSYEENNETKYYYMHKNNAQECYYCLVQNALYEESKTEMKTNAYQTALARERYAARTAINLDLVVADTSIEEPKDTTPPTITVNTPFDEWNVGKTISITITDNVGVTGWQVSKDANMPTIWEDLSGATSQNVEFTPEEEGTFYIHATDAEGNHSSYPVTITAPEPEVEHIWYNEKTKKWYADMASAFAEAQNGDTLTLEESYIDSSVATITKNITIDIGTNKLTKTTNRITVNSGAEVTIEGNGTITSEDITIMNYGKLIVKGGNISSSGSHAIRNQGEGIATINGGTISGGNGGSAAFSNYGTAYITGGTITSNIGRGIGNHATLKITGGNIESKSDSYTAVYNEGTITIDEDVEVSAKNIGIRNYGNLTVKNGNISSSTIHAIKNETGATMEIKGGTITGKGGSNYSAQEIIYNEGSLTISGGIIKAVQGEYGINNTGNGTTNISGGTVSANSIGIINNGLSKDAVKVSAGSITGSGIAISNTGTERVTVSGGTLSGGVVFSNSGSGSIYITGGTYSNNNGPVVAVNNGSVVITGKSKLTHTSTSTSNSAHVIQVSGSGSLTIGAASSHIDTYPYIYNSNSNGGNAISVNTTETVKVLSGKVESQNDYAITLTSGKLYIGSSDNVAEKWPVIKSNTTHAINVYAMANPYNTNISCEWCSGWLYGVPMPKGFYGPQPNMPSGYGYGWSNHSSDTLGYAYLAKTTSTTGLRKRSKNPI